MNVWIKGVIFTFQRWSTEVLWLISDASGLIVDVARIVQGATHSENRLAVLLLSPSRCCSVFSYRLRCSYNARARCAVACF
jgi:hypothetical protein